MKTIFYTIFLGACALWSVNASEGKEAETEHERLGAAAAREVLQSEREVVVLDVRTDEEFAGGHLAGAIQLDFLKPDFSERLEALDRDKTYLIYCASGGRSMRVFAAMTGREFDRVLHLDGGISAWTEAGFPIEK